MARGKLVKPLTLLALAVSLWAQAPENGKPYARMAIRNATVIDGNGAPAAGPKDIVIENNRIVAVVPAANDPSKRQPAAIEIDASGKYVLPGLINAHAHVQDERGGIA